MLTKGYAPSTREAAQTGCGCMTFEIHIPSLISNLLFWNELGPFLPNRTQIIRQ